MKNKKLPDRGLSARSRGKRCAKCGFRTIPGNRLALYEGRRLVAVICPVCLRRLLS